MLNFAERTGSGAVMLVWSFPKMEDPKCCTVYYVFFEYLIVIIVVIRDTIAFSTENTAFGSHQTLIAWGRTPLYRDRPLHTGQDELIVVGMDEL
eukprot:scaffold4949_cov134-Cylindrotheca_fusiformis.AAC.7